MAASEKQSAPFTDYYELLGVHTAADDEQLRRAWRQLAAQWHPDRAGLDATATFQQLSAAYDILSDPIARAAYDRRHRDANSATASDQRPPSRAAPSSAPAVYISRLSGPINSLLACGHAHLDEPGFITLILREAEAAQGGMVTISMPVQLWCPRCTPTDYATPCDHCDSTRMVDELFSAWLAIPPGIADGQILTPSVEFPDMVDPIRFRIRLHTK